MTRNLQVYFRQSSAAFQLNKQKLHNATLFNRFSSFFLMLANTQRTIEINERLNISLHPVKAQWIFSLKDLFSNGKMPKICTCPRNPNRTSKPVWWWSSLCRCEFRNWCALDIFKQHEHSTQSLGPKNAFEKALDEFSLVCACKPFASVYWHVALRVVIASMCVPTDFGVACSLACWFFLLVFLILPIVLHFC